MKVKAPVTDQQWKKHRAKARQAMPVQLEGASLPNILLRYQGETGAAIDENEVVVIEKARRIGETWGIGSVATLRAGSQRSAGGMDVLYIGFSLDMAREFIDVCAMWAKAFMPAVSEVEEVLFEEDENSKDVDDTKKIKAFRIIFASGFEIVALSSRPRSLRGRQGLVIIDEAAFHDNLPEVMKAAMALLIWGGKVVVLSTHDGVQNPFNLLCEEIRKGEKPYKLLKITFDNALADGLFQRICLVTGQTWSQEAQDAWRTRIYASYGEDAEEELDVVPKHGSGAYIPAGLIERSQVDECTIIRWQQSDAWGELAEHLQQAETLEWCERVLAPVMAAMPREYCHFVGEDFARIGDLTSLWVAAQRQDMTLWPVLLLELRNIPYEIQKLIVFFVLSRVPRLQGGCFDGTGNGGYLAEAAAKKFPGIIAVHLTASWYATYAPRFKAAFESDRTKTPRDVDVYKDHQAIKLVKGIPQVQREDQQTGKSEGGKKKFKRHGDSAIAHMLCYAATVILPKGPGKARSRRRRQGRKLTQGYAA